MKTHSSSRRLRVIKGGWLPKLQPIPIDGSTAGRWALDGYADLFLFRREDDRRWVIWSPADSSAERILTEHGLADLTFPTRKAALQAAAPIIHLTQDEQSAATEDSLTALFAA